MSNEVKKERGGGRGLRGSRGRVCDERGCILFIAADISAVDLSCFLAALHFASL